MKKILNLAILLLFIIGIIGAGSLVGVEIQTGNGCPKVWRIPACVIILICFVIPLISHIFRRYNGLYFFFTGLAATIAAIASIMQFTGNGECPKTGGGTPMCYYSFLLFMGLIVIKVYLLKKYTTDKN